MSALRKRLLDIATKLATFEKEGKRLSFGETGDAFQATETLEQICLSRQRRRKA